MKPLVTERSSGGIPRVIEFELEGDEYLVGAPQLLEAAKTLLMKEFHEDPEDWCLYAVNPDTSEFRHPVTGRRKRPAASPRRPGRLIKARRSEVPIEVDLRSRIRRQPRRKRAEQFALAFDD